MVEKIITADQALATQVLKIANSSFYRGLNEVGTVRAAIMRLGTKEIAKVVLLATSRNHFKSTDKTINLLMKKTVAACGGLCLRHSVAWRVAIPTGWSRAKPF